MKKISSKFLIVRCFTQFGDIDRNCKRNLGYAIENGLRTDVYIVPAPKVTKALDTAKKTIEAVGNNKVDIYWINVDNYDWGTIEENRAYLNQLVAELEKSNKKVGIHTNSYIWNQYMGKDWAAMASKPLWHKFQDGKKTCTDFKSFGGWKKPYMKEFEFSKICFGISLDTIC